MTLQRHAVASAARRSLHPPPASRPNERDAGHKPTGYLCTVTGGHFTPSRRRLRVENQLGFKHVKWISEIEFVHHFSERYAGQGGYKEEYEFFG